jgi:glycosyltransferase involved in cell wall biosynthesis
MNTARAMALGEINVFLCSLPEINNNALEISQLNPNIFHLHSKESPGKKSFQLFHSIFSLQQFIKERKSKSVIYLYPTSLIGLDWVYVIYFKLIKRNKLFCDINELRVTSLYNRTPPDKFFRKILFYFKYPFEYLKCRSTELMALFFDGLIVISTSLEKYFSKYSRRLIKIPILSDLSKSPDEYKLKSYNEGAFKICFSGTISNKKEGLELLFNAIGNLNQNKNVELHFYGSFPENEESILAKLSELYHIEHKVFYHGFLSPSDVCLELAKYHLLILPRPLNEQTKYGFSTKISEYLVSGVPTLLTDVSDNGIYIKDFYNGFLISPGSSSEMISKINQIIEHYNENANNIVRNAYKTAKENFDYRLYTNVIIDFIF